VSTGSYVSEEHIAIIFRLSWFGWLFSSDREEIYGKQISPVFPPICYALYGVETKKTINLSIAVKPQFVLHRVSACFRVSLLKILQDSNNFSSI
jgi:hypothetical protein